MNAAFVWISRADHIPARWDLRLLGWELVAGGGGADTPRLIDGRGEWREDDWDTVTPPALAAVVGIECADQRAAILASGLGEALPMQVAVGELAIRLRRLAIGHGALPRRRSIGPLTLDLLHRDAQAGARWLALHPREFALLWRLADAPGERVARDRLLRDVWRLARIPETNSLEVHVSRLRAKLAAAEAAWLVETDPRGGYRLACETTEASWTGLERLATFAAS